VHTLAVFARLAELPSMSREVARVVRTTPDTGGEAVRRLVTVLYAGALEVPVGHVVPPGPRDHRSPGRLDMLHVGSGLRADGPDVDQVDWQQIAEAFV
jgi:hypothetical protein